MESDSSNAIPWVTQTRPKPWKIQFYLNEIKELAYSTGVVSFLMLLGQ